LRTHLRRKNVIIVVLSSALLFTNGALRGLQLLESLVMQRTNHGYKLCALVQCISKVISFFQTLLLQT